MGTPRSDQLAAMQGGSLRSCVATEPVPRGLPRGAELVGVRDVWPATRARERVPGLAGQRIRRSALAVVLVLVAHAALARPRIAIDSPRWLLESRRDGISLYSARVEGTGIVPFKAVMTIPASIEEISAVLEDAPRRGEWVARFGGSTLLERRSDYEQVNYVRMTMPWPLTDRTARVRVAITVSDDLQTVVIAGRSVNCCGRPDLPEHVRAEIYESTFQMVRKPGGTEVTALAFVDPRGNLPSWVVNLFTGREARKTLEGLRRQVSRGLYAPATIEAFRRRISSYAAYRKGRR